jgi:nuclear distribution protein NudE
VSSLLDLESKYNRAIEEKTLLEQEVIQKQELDEECQRLKDELRGQLPLRLCRYLADPP